MGEVIRSNAGCWTCRVRRKKCDEIMPVCLNCASLQLPCHGYGPKPIWMDRGARERRVAQELRNLVKTKRNLSLRRRGQSSDASEPSTAGASQKTTTSTEATAPTGSAREHKEVAEQLLNNGRPSILTEPIEHDQAALLMHFFDHVLPLQFPFYNPSIQEGGRGWLLAIITQTKPLYQVALNLASYHQQSVLAKDSAFSCEISLAKLEERHIECIRLLRLHLDKFSCVEEVTTYEEHTQVMVCITFLIGLELFRGDTHDWQLHLQAASAFSSTCREGRRDSISSSPTQSLATVFFFSVITWYDILSCASTGFEPFLPFMNEIRFEKLQGCETWVMAIIAEIAQLNSRKQIQKRTDRLSIVEVEIVKDIRRRLEVGLRRTAAALDEDSMSRTLQVTRIYAHAASVYLHVMVSGPHPAIPEIRQGVSRTMVSIVALTYPHLIRNLMWPVCIAGCMAEDEHASYWRDLISSVSKEKWSFGYPSKVLEIMEECWRLRKTGAVVDWLAAMENLNMRVLLV
ncbi:uncharacterized protein BDZ99DRAFT_437239 [Mytilinidion resinicola]|uniref:Zn(2)-C6 fungal-type domain-containing protein n=1 Tax=Mytilinidion resinicola TaxID=574789 RepID=A0A6A6Z291_9PEZI|nr:uncharacterized protein BDZ99DRAFT_437239 [Mytilinidion resinicola]KAF2814347.1 hypothetical protein BDZ99DRAFT_437239 [Mytilinidion resinicola]